jgi:hypothetical protein
MMEIVTVLPVKYGMPNGAPYDLPAGEAQDRIYRGLVKETVPLDPERRRVWLAHLREKMERKAENHNETFRRFYLGDFRRYAAWLDEIGEEQALPLIPELVLRYLLKRGNDGLAEATIRRDLAGLAAMHSLTGHPPRYDVMANIIWTMYTRALFLAQKELAPGGQAICREERAARAWQMFGETGEVKGAEGLHAHFSG